MSTKAKMPYPAPPKKRPKKKTDPFWPIVIILSILAFTGSFWFFYMLTSKINTRTFSTTDTPKLMLTPTPERSSENSSMMVSPQTTINPEAFRVQVGIYPDQATAEQKAQKLKTQGYEPEIVTESGQYRVQLGVFEEQALALALAEKATQQGYEVVVRKISP